MGHTVEIDITLYFDFLADFTESQRSFTIKIFSVFHLVKESLPNQIRGGQDFVITGCHSLGKYNIILGLEGVTNVKCAQLIFVGCFSHNISIEEFFLLIPVKISCHI